MNKTKGEILGKLPQSGRACVEMLAVTLLAFWSMNQLQTWWSLPLNAIVFAVMLGVMLPRALRRISLGQLGFALIAFAAGSALAISCGMLIQNGYGYLILGAVLFAAGVALPVWARRFGGVWKVLGTVFTIPFMAILVHPLALDQSAGFFGWELVAAGVAFIWAVAIKVLENAQAPHVVQTAPEVHGAAVVQADQTATEIQTSRLPASTKMAIQLAVAVLAAFVCAKLVDADNLVWPVLTVLIVHSGNNGRGDIILKGVQRSIGALLGVTIASLIAINLPAADSVEIVAIFAILAFAAAVREYSYIFWALCIPAALVFLYSFFGQTGADITTHLAHRLLGITLGSAVGIASGYFILPIRVVDIVRLRLGALLAAASDFVIAAAHGTADAAALQRLAQTDSMLAHFDGVSKAARYVGIGVTRRLNSAITSAHELVKGLQDEAAAKDQDRTVLAALAREIGTARKSLSADTGAQASPVPDAPIDTTNPLSTYVQAIVGASLSKRRKE